MQKRIIFLFSNDFFYKFNIYRMATPRIINFIRLANRKHLITCSVPITSLRSNLHFPLFVPQATYAEQKSLSKSEQNESNSQIQVGFAEVGKS